jgi:predicted enzyme related to lactoylglutathione lyase
MINFRVKNLHQLLMNLKHSGVWVADKTEYYDYGSFGWIMDPEGNKIELWEPKDEAL